MSADSLGSFVDTNILVYAIADDDPIRTPIARSLVQRLMHTGELRTSTQVLQELYVVITRKLTRRLTSPQALRYLDEIAKHPVVVLEYSLIRAAAELSDNHAFSFWDGLVVVAAARSGASRLYSEDMQHGRLIVGVQIVNPFKN
jgi:predicted nucleic acid-binding protein